MENTDTPLDNTAPSKIEETPDQSILYGQAYIEILQTYKGQIEHSTYNKNNLKNCFFKTIEHILETTVGLFVFIMLGSLTLFGLMIYYDSASIEIIAGSITTIVASLVTLVLAILKLPKIIAKYLFNRDEDQVMNTIIKNIQHYELERIQLEILKLEKKEQLQLNAHKDAIVEGSPNDTGNINWPDDRITEEVDSLPTESIENSAISETVSSPNESSEEQTDPNIFKEVLS